MNIKNPLLQFILDGLLGVILSTLAFFLVNVVYAILYSGGSIIGAVELFLGMSFMPAMAPELVPLVLITSFVGTGSGTRLLRKTTSRWSWLVPSLGMSLIAWLTAMGVIAASTMMYPEPEARAYAAYFLPMYANASGFGAIVGFVIAILIGMLFNPVLRPIKVLMAGITSTITGFTLALAVLFARLFPT